MRRPLADKRPIGPFAQVGSMPDNLVFNLKFTDTEHTKDLFEIIEKANEKAIPEEGRLIASRGSPGRQKIFTVQWSTGTSVMRREEIDEFMDIINSELANRNIPSKFRGTVGLVDWSIQCGRG